MELSGIEIENFKSIKYIELDLKKNYHVIAGKNESGKSNLLNAINFLDPNLDINSTYIREPLPDETPIQESYIYFIFQLNEKEIDKIYNEIYPLFFGLNHEDIIGEEINKKINLHSFIGKRSEGIICIDFINKNRTYLFWDLLEDEYKLNLNWKKVLENCPDNVEFTDKSLKSYFFKKYMFVNSDEIEYIPSEYITEATFEDINSNIGTKIIAILKKQIINLIFWNHDEKNFLPANIDINQFKENPNLCLPLLHLFNLSGITDIKTEMDLASSKSTKGVPNLLQRVSRHATIFFNEKWKEYEEIEFNLTLNGSNIEIGIKEHNNFNFNQRSDGFKRFVTFLIMISAKVQTNQINDTIIIIDEPEIGLHPSGQRYLKEELKKISESNKVIFSTHSIFLIDPNNLENHYIVEKINESTKINEVGRSNIIDEEVIFNALGYSVFENLKHFNILFEGWRDKFLFKVAISRIPAKFNEISKLKDFGTTHAQGVKDIKHVVPILELANRDCIIISDSDKPAKEKQNEYLKEHHYAKWFRYDELLTDEVAITSEDFIKSDIILKYLNKIRIKFNLPDINVTTLENPKGKIHTISDWLRPIGQDSIKEELNEMKEFLFNNLKSTQIEEKYYKLLVELNKKINNS